MKRKIILIVALSAACSVHTATAQVSVHFNIGVQPIWGPVGYDYAQYYNMPDIGLLQRYQPGVYLF